MTIPTKPVRAYASKTLSFNPSLLFTIRAGQGLDRKDFIIHESFLTSRSGFFRRAMNGNWQESASRVVSLPEDDPQIVALYLNHIYTGQLNTMRMSKEELSTLQLEEFKAHVEIEYRDLFHLYVLAERFQDRATKDAAITAAIDVSRSTLANGTWIVPSCAAINGVYEGTLKGSPARRLVTDLCSALSVQRILRNFQSTVMHQDFLSDIAESLEKIRPKKEGTAGNLTLINGLETYMEEV